jgi:hypothetical protein
MKQMLLDAYIMSSAIQGKIKEIGEKLALGATDPASMASWTNTAQQLYQSVLDRASVISGMFSKFAGGTDFAPGGLSLVGEQGPELVMMPRGAQVKTAAETRDIMSGAGGRTISFTFNSPRELSPSEMMERSRESARRLAFEGAF